MNLSFPRWCCAHILHVLRASRIAILFGGMLILVVNVPAQTITPTKALAANYQDVWSGGPGENGWGLNIAQQGDTLVAGWYVFGPDGAPTYYLMQGGTWNSTFTTFTGPLFQSVSGAPFSNYDPALFVPGPQIGTLALTFSDSNNAIMNYSANGVTGTKSIKRLIYGSGSAVNDYAAVWSGGTSQNGWGIAIAQQGATLVAAWYTFGSNGKPIWYILGGGTWLNSTTYQGPLTVATGAPVVGVPYNAAAFSQRSVGSMTLAFSGLHNATMTYTVDGLTQSKSIERLAFGAPPPPALYQGDAFQPTLASAAGSSCFTLQDVSRQRAVPVQVRYPINATGQRPVVVFSHGGGPRDVCSFGNPEWGDVLTRAGYVVVHISHNLDTAGSNFACAAIGKPGCNTEEALRYFRPGDARLVVSQIATIAAHFGISARVDANNIGMAGHSFGAYTTMAVAGARYDLGTLTAVSSKEPAIKSALALSPQGPGQFGWFDRGGNNHSWADVSMPVLIQTGLGDDTGEFQGGEGPADRRIPFQKLAAPNKAEVFINDILAQHNSFNLNATPGTPPAFQTWIAAAGVAWFDATLQQRASAFAWLESEGLAQASSGLTNLSRKQLQNVPKDIRVGDPTTNYFSLEISPNMRYIAWQETFPTGPVVWIGGIDPNTAELIPPDGRGFQIPNTPITSAPQWGMDTTGVFLVTIDRLGRVLQVRPTSPTTATVTILPLPANTTRQYPYPSRLPARTDAYLLYIQNDTQGRQQLWFADLAQPGAEVAITSGPVDFYFQTPSFLATIFRWFPGLPRFSYGFNDASGKLQMKVVDVAGLATTTKIVSNDPFDHLDDFPAVLNNQQYLLGGVNGTVTGAVYRQDPATGLFPTLRQFTAQNTGLANPRTAASMEPFTWKGRSYATYIILDGGGTPGSFPAQVWLTSVTDDAVLRRVSGQETLNRLDPEVYLGNNLAWVFYYARPPAGGNYELRRAELALP